MFCLTYMNNTHKCHYFTIFPKDHAIHGTCTSILDTFTYMQGKSLKMLTAISNISSFVIPLGSNPLSVYDGKEGNSFNCQKNWVFSKCIELT